MGFLAYIHFVKGKQSIYNYINKSLVAVCSLIFMHSLLVKGLIHDRVKSVTAKFTFNVLSSALGLNWEEGFLCWYWDCLEAIVTVKQLLARAHFPTIASLVGYWWDPVTYAQWSIQTSYILTTLLWELFLRYLELYFTV